MNINNKYKIEYEYKLTSGEKPAATILINEYEKIDANKDHPFRYLKAIRSNLLREY